MPQSDLVETPTLGVPPENENEEDLIEEQSAYFKKCSPLKEGDHHEGNTEHQNQAILKMEENEG